MTTITSAVATLMTAGMTAITNSVTSSLPLQISRFQLGAIAAVAVPLDTTTALPSSIYEGAPSRVLLEQENGLAVFNVVLDEAIGDFYAGNLALFVIDPISGLEVLLGVIMFPTTIYKIASEAEGGATGETGNYYVVKLAIRLSSMQTVANVTLNNTTFATLPSIPSLNQLADPGVTTYPHQILLNTPETGAPSLLARRMGDNLWWGYSLSWPADAHNFGVISGGYQGDAYADDHIDVLFGGFFHMQDADFGGTVTGGTNWVGGSNINLINGGTWS